MTVTADTGFLTQRITYHYFFNKSYFGCILELVNRRLSKYTHIYRNIHTHKHANTQTHTRMFIKRLFGVTFKRNLVEELYK